MEQERLRLAKYCAQNDLPEPQYMLKLNKHLFKEDDWSCSVHIGSAQYNNKMTYLHKEFAIEVCAANAFNYIAGVPVYQGNVRNEYRSHTIAQLIDLAEKENSDLGTFSSVTLEIYFRLLSLKESGRLPSMDIITQ